VLFWSHEATLNLAFGFGRKTLIVGKMKFPLLIAHGQNVIFALLALGAGASLMGIVSILAGLTKKKGKKSRLGIVAGLLAGISGIAFCGIHRFEPPYDDPLMLALTAPLLLGILGFGLSMRRADEPKQPPVPMRGNGP
jgi:O-antigen ligase